MKCQLCQKKIRRQYKIFTVTKILRLEKKKKQPMWLNDGTPFFDDLLLFTKIKINLVKNFIR